MVSIRSGGRECARGDNAPQADRQCSRVIDKQEGRNPCGFLPCVSLSEPRERGPD